MKNSEKIKTYLNAGHKVRIETLTDLLFERFGNLVSIDDFGEMIEQEDGELLNKKIAEFLLSLQDR